MKKPSLYILAGMIFLISSPLFAERIRIAAVGVADDTSERTNQPAPKSPETESYSGDMQYGGGFLVDFGMSQRLDFEIGGLFFDRKAKATEDNVTSSLDATITDKMKVVEIPFLFRYWLGRVVSVGVGGYYDHYSGTPTATTTFSSVSNGSTVGTPTTSNVSNAATYDAGAEASVGIDLPFSNTVSLMIDGRYQYGLVNQETSPSAGYAYKWNSFQGLAGLRFNLR